jgi:hypothetical protein
MRTDFVPDRSCASAPCRIGPMIAALVSEGNRWVNAQRIEVGGIGL